MTPRLAWAAALVSLGVAGCGDDDATDAPIASTADSPAGTGTVVDATTFNEADIAFAQGMVPHHRQAVEMADLALDPSAGAGEAVLDLATRVKAARDPEIVQMTGWLQQWGQPVTSDSADGHDMTDAADDAVDGMMTNGEMDELAAAQVSDFDRLWMEMMIRHHAGAITKAETEQADGASPEATALAGAIIAAQQAEIDEMTGLLDQLG